ncbi:hypothetical protein AB0G48_19230 [Streptomyces rubiginosohelvolus]|uniref:hypothetical protein n=1 Tax=Streptomyces rubiginosohelvolus TaxID=67362 RepID=UPI0033E84E7E
MTSDAAPADAAGAGVAAPPEKPSRGWGRTGFRVSVGLYLLAAALMLATGLLGAREWYVALGCWLAGSIAVPVGHGVRAGGEMGWEAWRLRTRGVLVEGRRVYARTYEFTDAEGRTRRLTDDYASGERVEILHDPAPGRDTAQIGHRTTGTLVFAGCVCLLSLVMAVALVTIGLLGPLAALGIISLGL